MCGLHTHTATIGCTLIVNFTCSLTSYIHVSSNFICCIIHYFLLHDVAMVDVAMVYNKLNS